MQSKSRLGMYKSSWHCAKEIVRGEGVTGLFQGLETAWVRSGVSHV